MACRIAAGDHSPSIVKTSQSFHDASRIAFGTNGCSRDRDRIINSPTDRIINSPARSPVLEAVLNGAYRSYVNFAPPAYPSAGAIGASLVVSESSGKLEGPEVGRGESRARHRGRALQRGKLALASAAGSHETGPKGPVFCAYHAAWPSTS